MIPIVLVTLSIVIIILYPVRVLAFLVSDRGVHGLDSNPLPIRYLWIDKFGIRHQSVAVKNGSDLICGGPDRISFIRLIR